MNSEWDFEKDELILDRIGFDTEFYTETGYKVEYFIGMRDVPASVEGKPAVIVITKFCSSVEGILRIVMDQARLYHLV